MNELSELEPLPCTESSPCNSYPTYFSAGEAIVAVDESDTNILLTLADNRKDILIYGKNLPTDRTLTKGEYRKATSAEIAHNQRFSLRIHLENLKTMIRNLQSDAKTGHCLRDAIERVKASPGKSTVDRILDLEEAHKNFTNNTAWLHYLFELEFAKKHDSELFNDADLDKINPFVLSICQGVELSGHSGFAIGFHANLIAQIIKETNNNRNVVTWSALAEIESKYVKPDSEMIKIVFHPSLEPSAIIRKVPTLNSRQADLLRRVIKDVLLMNNLTPLSLGDDEWVDHGYTKQNRRCSKVFIDPPSSDEPQPKAHYIGVYFCDNPELRSFFSGRRSRLNLEPFEEMKEYYVYLKYPFEVEPGTTPDGDLSQYSYIPPMPELVPDITVRKYSGEIYRLIAVTDYSVELKAQRDDSIIEISRGEFSSTGMVNGCIYPNWQVLPPYDLENL